MDEPTSRADGSRADDPAAGTLDNGRPTMGGEIEVSGPGSFRTVADGPGLPILDRTVVPDAIPAIPGPDETAAPSASGPSTMAREVVPRGQASDHDGLTIAGDVRSASRAPAPSIPGYEIIDELGRGGMGVVYKARQVQLDRTCALKMILAGAHANPQAISRFLSEAQAIARLHDPRIVQIYSIGEADGLPYVELEYLPGGSLDRQLDGTPWQPDRAARLVEQLARGIAEAHRLEIVHRDLKPANVLLSADGTPKISDFGLAKFLGSDSGLTGSGAIMGSPSYMAPEQAEGKAREVGPAADVYAMGAILYELLTGRPPFRGTTILETLEQVKTAEPVPPSHLVPRLPRDIETICLKCLQKEPGKRYGGAEALAEDLRRFHAGEPIVARPVGGVERAWRWCRRNKTVAVLMAVVVMALLLGTTVSTYFAVRATQEKELSEHRLYLAEMIAARQAWQEGRITLVEQYLQAHEPKRPGDRDRRGFEWYYLQRLCQLDLRTMHAHAGGASCLAHGPDGRTLATGGRDNSVKLWDVATGQEIRTLGRHTRPVQSVAFSRDGRTLASASLDMTVKIWEVATGRELRTLRGHAGEIWGVTYSPDGRALASAGLDKTIRLWDAADGREIRTLRGHAEGVNGVVYSADGRTLASAGRDNLVKLWDPEAGREIRTLQGHTAPVTCVVFSPDGRTLASGGEDRTVRFWDVATGHEARALLNTPDAVRAVTYGPDGQTLASAGDDNIVRVWDTKGRETLGLRGHAGRVQGVSFSRDGRTLASASADNSVKVWDASSSQEVVTLRGPAPFLDGTRVLVALNPGGRIIASAGYSPASGGNGARRRGRVTARDAETGQIIWRRLALRDGFDSMTFSADGHSLSLESRWRNKKGFGTFVTYDAATGREIREARWNKNGIETVTYDIATGREIQKNRQPYPGGLEYLPPFQYTPVGADRNLMVRDLDTDREVIILRGRSRRPVAAAVSRQGRFAGAEISDSVTVWDTLSGQEVLTLRGASHDVRCLAFSDDGLTLASASQDGSLNVWDARPMTPEFHVIREARSVVEFLLARPLPTPEVAACIRRDPTISEPVRERALALAEEHERSLSLRETERVEDEAVRFKDEVAGVVRGLFDRLVSRPEVLDYLRADSTLSEPVRRKALALVESTTQDTWLGPSAAHLNASSWNVARAPGSKIQAYQRALRQAEEACRLEPNNGLYLNTLGVAQYRVGEYLEAAETLTRSDRLNAGDFSGSHPADLAFLALVRHRLGQSGQARALLGRLREALKDPKWAGDQESQDFLREAEAMEHDRTAPTDPSAP